MNIVISFTLYTIAILTLVKGFAIYKHNHDNVHKKQYILYSIAAFFSSVWSFGYAMLYVQLNPDIARYWRAFGMLGVFLMFAFITDFMVQWLEGAKIFKTVVTVFAFLGIFLWPFVIGKESVSFYQHNNNNTHYQSLNDCSQFLSFCTPQNIKHDKKHINSYNNAIHII